MVDLRYKIQHVTQDQTFPASLPHPTTSATAVRYSAARCRLAELHTEQQQHDELLQLGHAALHQLNARMEAVACRIRDQAASLDGSLPIQQMREAITSMHREMREMDVRLGVAQYHVTRYQASRRLLMQSSED